MMNNTEKVNKNAKKLKNFAKYHSDASNLQ